MLPDSLSTCTTARPLASQCTYRCVVLPDLVEEACRLAGLESQCTYRCVVLPDGELRARRRAASGLNAPTGAWCSLTYAMFNLYRLGIVSMHLQVRGAP